jgi:hypothetical protein
MILELTHAENGMLVVSVMRNRNVIENFLKKFESASYKSAYDSWIKALKAKIP